MAEQQVQVPNQVQIMSTRTLKIEIKLVTATETERPGRGISLNSTLRRRLPAVQLSIIYRVRNEL